MPTNIWMIGPETGLEEMLRAREQRALKQKEMQERKPGTLVCFTLNIAGPIKVFPLAEETFSLTADRIQSLLWKNGFSVTDRKQQDNPAGWEAYFCVDGDALEVKKVLLQLEEGDPAGRLFDIDVLRADGTKVSRQELGLPARSCLICGRETAACARSRAHTVTELQNRTAELLVASLRRQRLSSYMIGRLCRQAMLLEVYTTPKPGLVDRNNSGAHRDMDVALFEKSTEVLEPFFVEFAVTGRELYEEAPEDILRCIRPIGIRAEQAMFKATRGVNTHKGMIFSLGILAAATGYCAAGPGGGQVSLDRILSTAGLIAAPAYKEDYLLLPLEETHIPTTGERLHEQYGVGGIRQEAAQGFPSVVRWSWPILAGSLDRGYDWNQAGALALLNLMAHVTDTNMIKRSSIQEAEALRRRIGEWLEKPEGVRESEVLALDEELIAANISAGGCADLLALTYYIYELACLL